MANPMIISSGMEKPRRRLIRQYHRLGSYQRLADARGVNWNYVYNFIVHRKIPVNPKIRKKLGIYFLPKPVTINQLLQLPIQDQPVEILRLALENRTEMKT